MAVETKIYIKNRSLRKGENLQYTKHYIFLKLTKRKRTAAGELHLLNYS